MKVFCTLKGEIYEAVDVALALQCAEAASRQFGWQVRALVETLHQRELFNGVQGFAWQGSNQFRFNSVSGEMLTRRQYHPGSDEMLVVVCPTIQLLQVLQHETQHIKALIVVPEMKSCIDIYHWLDLYSATDIQTSATLSGIALPAEGIRRAVGFLMDYCNNTGIDLTHTPLLTGEIANVANTLKEKGIFASYDEVMKYCLLRGLPYKEAEILAKALSQQSRLQMRGKPNCDYIWKTIDDPKWE